MFCWANDSHEILSLTFIEKQHKNRILLATVLNDAVIVSILDIAFSWTTVDGYRLDGVQSFD